MTHVLFAIGKLAVGSVALTPAQARAAAIECHAFEWRCERSMTTLQSSAKPFGIPTVKVRTVRIHVEHKSH